MELMRRKGRSSGQRPNADVADRASALERGREAYARRIWNEAYELLAGIDERAPLAPADLELLARAAALSGRDEEYLKVLERLHGAYLDVKQGLRAARAAFWLGLRLFSLAEPGRAGGWIARAHRLVESEGQRCVEEGYLLLPVVQRSLAAGDFKAAYDAATRAADIGDRFRETDLSIFARNLQGRALMRQGRIKDGLALLDEVMVVAATGQLSPIVTGLIYCSAIAACQQVYVLDRAREWTSALARWCEAQPQLVTFSGICLVHRAEIKELSGAWPEAFEEARRASERLSRAIDSKDSADAIYQQGEIHRLRGELTQAEDAYRAASQLGREPQPGLALLRMIQGRPDAAVHGIRRALGAATESLQRTRLLPATVEIMLAVGEIDEARRAGGELEEIAARFDTEVLGAMAAHARGAVQLAEGAATAALGPLRRAFAVWQQVGAPYLAARVRVLVGLACQALGDRDGSTLELDAARSTFARLGAQPDLLRLEALTHGSVADDRQGLTPRELEVLRLVATGKTNRAIAKELFLSEKTVDRHVSNIFTKVNVPSRAAATAYAYEHKLL
jgi:DNA-binding CsgD family transcriptional regulator